MIFHLMESVGGRSEKGEGGASAVKVPRVSCGKEFQKTTPFLLSKSTRNKKIMDIMKVTTVHSNYGAHGGAQ